VIYQGNVSNTTTSTIKHKNRENKNIDYDAKNGKTCGQTDYCKI